MKNLNYNKLMNLNPTKYSSFLNSRGQRVDLLEHPLKGDEYPIIIVIEGFAVCSDFFDTEDLEQGGDYEPFLTIDNKILLEYEN